MLSGKKTKERVFAVCLPKYLQTAYTQTHTQRIGRVSLSSCVPSRKPSSHSMHVTLPVPAVLAGPAPSLLPPLSPDLSPGHFPFFFFLTVLGRCCCMHVSLVAASRGYSSNCRVCLLIVVACLVAEHRLQGAWASVVVAPGL